MTWRVPTRHHASVLLLPDAGDPELDRYFIAQVAREVLFEDLQQRRRELAQQQKVLLRR